MVAAAEKAFAALVSYFRALQITIHAHHTNQHEGFSTFRVISWIVFPSLAMSHETRPKT